MAGDYIVRSSGGRVDTWVSFDVRRAYARRGGELIVGWNGLTWHDPETDAFHHLGWEEFADFMRHVGSPIDEPPVKAPRRPVRQWAPPRTLQNPYGRTGEGLVLD